MYKNSKMNYVVGRNLNVHFAGTAEKLMPVSAKKPPVPQRCISLDATNGGNGVAMSGMIIYIIRGILYIFYTFYTY